MVGHPAYRMHLAFADRDNVGYGEGIVKLFAEEGAKVLVGDISIAGQR